MPVVTNMTFEPGNSVIVLCSLAVGLAVLGRSYQAVRGTSLVGSWMWAAGALVGWAAVELAADLSLVGSGNRESLRFVAIAVSFCPIVAVLGAKRPQDV